MKSTQAQAAKMIREELKNNFPKIKFRVGSRSFSGGDAVDISWENGPTQKEVSKIASKYQYGSFDGMRDIYEYDNKNSDLPQAKYVQVRRKVNDQIFNEAFEYIRYSWRCLEGKNIDDSSEEINKQLGTWTARNYLYRFLDKIDLTPGLTKQKLEDVIYNR